MTNLLVCFLINFYCLCVAIAVKKLHALDFYIVLLQTFFDCFFVGFVGLLFKILDIVNRFVLICNMFTISLYKREILYG